MKINGWYRLWIVVSVLWISIFFAIAFVSYRQSSDGSSVSNSTAVQYLDEGYREFYPDTVPESKQPAFKIYVELKNKEKVWIQFESPLPNSIERFEEDILEIARERKTSADQFEISLFLMKLKTKISEANKASRELERIKANLIESRREAALKDVFDFLPIAFIPPLFLLLLGHSLVWVMRGFSKK